MCVCVCVCVSVCVSVCGEGYQNNMAKIFFTSGETVCVRAPLRLCAAAFEYVRTAKAIRNLFHSEETFPIQTLAIFFVVYYILVRCGRVAGAPRVASRAHGGHRHGARASRRRQMVINTGSSMPGGLFVPSLLAGCALGRLCGTALQLALPSYNIDAGVFALIGGACVRVVRRLSCARAFVHSCAHSHAGVAVAFLGGSTRMTISLTVIMVYRR